MSISHPYTPAHMTRTSDGNVPPCCDKPEADHPPFIDGTTTTVVLRRDVRTLHSTIIPKGTVVEARRDNRAHSMQQIKAPRWFKNERGNMEEERGEYRDVAVPGWTVRFPGDEHLTGLPWKWAKEV